MKYDVWDLLQYKLERAEVNRDVNGKKNGHELIIVEVR